MPVLSIESGVLIEQCIIYNHLNKLTSKPFESVLCIDNKVPNITLFSPIHSNKRLKFIDWLKKIKCKYKYKPLYETEITIRMMMMKIIIIIIIIIIFQLLL